MDSRCSHVLNLWFGQTMQLGLEYVSGEKMLFQWILMYWAYWNFKVCIICALDMLEAF